MREDTEATSLFTALPKKSILSREATELDRRVAPRLALNDAAYMARATFWAKPLFTVKMT